MQCNFSIRKRVVNGSKKWLFAPVDTLTPYRWTKLKHFMEKAGAKYIKAYYAFVFDFNPKEVVNQYIEQHCDGFIPNQVPFAFNVKIKTNHAGPIGVQNIIKKRVSDSQKPKKKKTKSRHKVKHSKVDDKFLLKKRLVENEAELILLKSEGVKLVAENQKTRLAVQKKRDDEKQKDLAAKEEKKKEGIMNVAREILAAENENELDRIEESWTGNKAVMMFIASRRDEIKEDNNNSLAVARKKAVIKSLAAADGRTVTYEWMEALGIQRTSESLIIYGIHLDRTYYFHGYLITVPKDLKIPDFNLKI